MPTLQGKFFTELILEVFKLGGLLVSEGDRLTSDLGLTSARWKVLGAIALSGTPLTVSQVARTMGQTRQSVQRIADRMNQGGLLIYEDNPAHKRAKLLCLTNKGKKLYSSLESIQAPWANHSAKDVDVKDLKTTVAVVRQLINQFEK